MAKSTITDVARKARVSVGTVSHVLSGRTKVSERLRQRVMQAVEGLGYVPNFHARGLRGKRSSVVGLCLPHISTAYLSGISEGIEQLAATDGYSILHVFSRYQPQIELRRIKELLSYRVDGVLLFPSSAPNESLQLIHRKGVPAVLLDHPADQKRFDHVLIDNRKAMETALQALVDHGHSRILFINRSRDISVTKHRLDGLAAFKRRMGRRVTIDTLEFGDDEQALKSGLHAALFFADPATALIASNSHQAALVLGHLKEFRVACPDRVSLLAFDEPEWATVVTPTLSVMRQPAQTIAEKSWELLMDRINTGHRKPRIIAIDSRLELRESVGMPATARREKASLRS